MVVVVVVVAAATAAVLLVLVVVVLLIRSLWMRNRTRTSTKGRSMLGVMIVHKLGADKFHHFCWASCSLNTALRWRAPVDVN